MNQSPFDQTDPFNFNAAPAVTVVEERQAPDGSTWQKLSDGTTRPKPAVVAAVAPDPFGAAAAPPPNQPPPTAAALPWQSGGAANSNGAGARPMPTELDVDEQTAGMRPPLGTFDVRLATCVGERSKSVNKDTQEPWRMVVCSLEIVQGVDETGKPAAGREVRHSYLLDPRWNEKTHKWNSRGIAEIREDLAKIGSPLPAGYRISLSETDVARVVAQGMQGKTFRIMVYEETRQKKDPVTGQSKADTRATVKIVGPQGTQAVAASATGATAADPFGAFR